MYKLALSMYYFIFSKIMDKVYIYWEIDDYDLHFTKSKFVYFNVVYSLYFVSKYIGNTSFVLILRKGIYVRFNLLQCIMNKDIETCICFMNYNNVMIIHTLYNYLSWRKKSLVFGKTKGELYRLKLYTFVIENSVAKVAFTYLMHWPLNIAQI